MTIFTFNNSIILRRCYQNWKPALTVSLVSIPFSLALAVASGATPTQGIITAFWAGLIGAILGGGHYNIVGPTGALSGILISASLTYGYSILPVIALISGSFILLAYILHLDKYIIFIPRSVVYGFTLGIAFIIVLGQFNGIFGLSNIPKTKNILYNIWIGLHHFSEVRWTVFIIFAVSTLIIFLWNKKYPKFPGAVLAAFLGICIVTVLQKTNSSFQLITLGDQYPNIKATLFENIFIKLSIKNFLHKDIWVLSMASAVIGILETLLSGQIAQNMTDVKFDRSKEVLGLAIANIASGLLGGIPATAALARTALNIKSGANHRTSGIISSLLVGIIALFLFYFFKLLPVVIIASILTILAIGMFEKKHFIKLIENEKVAFVLSILVAFITIVEDPVAGVILGTFIALIIFVNKVSYGQTEILFWRNGKMIVSLLKSDFIKKKEIDSDMVVYKISGTLTYINMPAHLEAIKRIKRNKYVIVSLRNTFYADSDGSEYLEELIELLKNNNGKVYLSGINSEVHKLIIKEKFYKQKLAEKRIYNRTSEAINDIFRNDETLRNKNLF